MLEYFSSPSMRPHHRLGWLSFALTICFYCAVVISIAAGVAANVVDNQHDPHFRLTLPPPIWWGWYVAAALEDISSVSSFAAFVLMIAEGISLSLTPRKLYESNKAIRIRRIMWIVASIAILWWILRPRFYN